MNSNETDERLDSELRALKGKPDADDARQKIRAAHARLALTPQTRREPTRGRFVPVLALAAVVTIAAGATLPKVLSSPDSGTDSRMPRPKTVAVHADANKSHPFSRRVTASASPRSESVNSRSILPYAHSEPSNFAPETRAKMAKSKDQTEHLRSTRSGAVRVGPAGGKERNSPATGDSWFLRGDGVETYARRTFGENFPAPEAVSEADFIVTLPGGIASADASVGAVGAAQRAKDAAEIVDARLLRRVSASEKGVSFTELCQRMKAQTGVEIDASRGVADDKITLFCKDRPLRDVFRMVANHFGLVWERGGNETAWRYTLKQPFRAQLMEEEMRNRDRNEALLALDKQMERLTALGNLSPEQARVDAENATGDRKKDLDLLGGMGWAPSKLYAGLSNDEREALFSGKPLNFGKDGAPMPPGVRASAIQSLDGHAFVSDGGISMYSNREHGKNDKSGGRPITSVPDIEPEASLTLQRDEAGKFTLVGGTGFSHKNGSASTTVNLASAVSPSVESPDNARANDAESKKPEMRKPTALALPEPAKGAPKNGDMATSADILEAIHKATGRDVVGDFFTVLHPRSVVPTGQKPLFDTLNTVCDTTRLRWKSSENWLTFRSTSFFNDRLKEVPNRLLARWRERRAQKGRLEIDALCEISRLTDDQLDARSMAEGARVLWTLNEWELVRAQGQRKLWRFLDSLSAGERARVVDGQTLMFSTLSPDSRRRFLEMAGERNGRVRELSENARADDPAVLRFIQGASLRLELARPDERPFRADPSTGKETPRDNPELWAVVLRLPITPGFITTTRLTQNSTSSSGEPEGKE